ncbi:MAG: bifunctional hydroxymethylpyrimidine kinase/phosphomethylpyrimidine kinase [Bdellovibrionota bacterium]
MKIKCLTIAGFDGSGGAGIQADLKTFSALGCYGMTVLTALPVQNTCGVRNCYEIPLQAIQDQLEAIFEDIIPNSIKIGMLFSSPIIELVADFLKKHCQNIPIVVDPVMVAKSGDALLLPDAVEFLKKKLIPLAAILTPNLPEAQALVGDLNDSEKLSAALLELGPQSVLLKGGHSLQNTCNDLFVTQHGISHWLKAERIHTKNTHGTGCTLSSAICCFLAQGFTPLEACQKAKEYLLGAIEASQENSVGLGHGPVHHFYHLWSRLSY